MSTDEKCFAVLHKCNNVISDIILCSCRGNFHFHQQKILSKRELYQTAIFGSFCHHILNFIFEVIVIILNSCKKCAVFVSLFVPASIYSSWYMMFFVLFRGFTILISLVLKTHVFTDFKANYTIYLFNYSITVIMTH